MRSRASLTIRVAGTFSISLLLLSLVFAAAVAAMCLIAGIKSRRTEEILRQRNILLDGALNNMTQGLNIAFNECFASVLERAATSDESFAVLSLGPVGQVGERIVVREPRNARFRALPFGDILDDGEQIARLAVVAHDRQPGGGDDAAAPGRKLDRMLVEELPGVVRQHLLVIPRDLGRDVRREHVACGLADHALAGEAVELLGAAIDQGEGEIAGRP